MTTHGRLRDLFNTLACSFLSKSYIIIMNILIKTGYLKDPRVSDGAGWDGDICRPGSDDYPETPQDARSVPNVRPHVLGGTHHVSAGWQR